MGGGVQKWAKVNYVICACSITCSLSNFNWYTYLLLQGMNEGTVKKEGRASDSEEMKTEAEQSVESVTGNPNYTKEVRRLSMGLPISHFEVINQNLFKGERVEKFSLNVNRWCSLAGSAALQAVWNIF